jgi:hypothetical protein
MANPGYARSTDGLDADNGSTWALANATLTGACADAVAGDQISVSDNHAESTGSAVTIAFPGTVASPNRVLCVDDAAEPATAVAATGTVSTAGTFGIQINGCAYVYGLRFNNAVGGATANFVIGGADGDIQFYDNCKFHQAGTGSGASIRVGNTTSGSEQRISWKDVQVGLGHIGQSIRLSSAAFEWRGGSVIGGTTSPTNAFLPNTNNGAVLANISGVDFSGWGAGVNLVGGTQTGNARVVFRDCRLPASWSGVLMSGALMVGGRVEMHNCDSDDTNYRLWVEDYFGSIKSETVIVRTGGATDGETPLSWKMTSSADTEFPHQVLYSPEIAIWVDTAGVLEDLTVEIVTDNVTLTDAECWVEVLQVGTVGYPLGEWLTDAPNVLASAANHSTSTETWTTTGLGTPVKQKIERQIMPFKKGYINVRVALAKPSTTVYVCPKVDVVTS